MFIDTHCHINIIIKDQFDTLLTPSEIIKAESIYKEALEASIQTIINVGTSVNESMNCITLANKFEHMHAMIGTHPSDVHSAWKNDCATYKKLLKNKKHNKIVAIGEIGLDYFRPGFNKNMQYDLFKSQIELALEFNIPIAIHTRNAHDETLKIISEYKNNNIKGIIHCFSEGKIFAQDAINLGFLLGIGGTLTYPKNTLLREIFSTIPLESIVLETDAPFLPPQIIRGKQNSPIHIITIAQKLADIRNSDISIIGNITTNNAQLLLSIHP